MELASILQIATVTLGMAVGSRADQIVLDVTFQSPGTNLGNYAAGTEVGNPNTGHVQQGYVTVVEGPCTTGGGSGQCLRARLPGALRRST